MKTYYEVLGVEPGCSPEELKKAFKKVALDSHPDRGGDPIRFREANEAFQTLGDPDKRAIYDLNMSIKSKSSPKRDPLSDFEDFFNVASVRNRTRNVDSSPPPTSGRGDDIHVEVTISLQDSLQGCQPTVKTIGSNLTEDCQTCHGSGGTPNAPRIACGSCAGHGKSVSYSSGMKVQACRTCGGRGNVSVSPCKKCRGSGKSVFEQRIQIKVPAGVVDGDNLRLSGRGCPGQPPGDLYVKVRVESNSTFQRDGMDIHMVVSVPFATMIVGGKSSVIGPDGSSIDIEIPAGSQTDDSVIVLGKGVLAKMSNRRGNLVVRLKPELPKRITARGRKLLEEFTEENQRFT